MPGEDKRYSVKVTPTAYEMLLSHARFLANVGADAAENLIAAFSEKAESLSSMPERNPWFSTIGIPKQKYRKLVLDKRYLVLYQVYEDTVYINAVVDCRQDLRLLIL